MPTIDADLTLLRDAIDKRGSTDADPGEAFWDALQRRHALLKRTAKLWGWEVPVNAKDPLPPGTIRKAASYLLAN